MKAVKDQKKLLNQRRKQIRIRKTRSLTRPLRAERRKKPVRKQRATRMLPPTNLPGHLTLRRMPGKRTKRTIRRMIRQRMVRRRKPSLIPNPATARLLILPTRVSRQKKQQTAPQRLRLPQRLRRRSLPVRHRRKPNRRLLPPPRLLHNLLLHLPRHQSPLNRL